MCGGQLRMLSVAYNNLGDAESHIDKAVEALEEIKASAPSNPLASIFG